MLSPQNWTTFTLTPPIASYCATNVSIEVCVNPISSLDILLETSTINVIFVLTGFELVIVSTGTSIVSSGDVCSSHPSTVCSVGSVIVFSIDPSVVSSPIISVVSSAIVCSTSLSCCSS